MALSCVFIGAIVMFFAGYQLAIYQEANGDTLLPHFDVNPSGSNCNGADLCCGENGGGGAGDMCDIAAKPVIYLYPTHTERVNIKLHYPAGFSTTVPTYNTQLGWNVVAQPDGTLTNAANGMTYPYLFWEGNPASLKFDMTQGFVVPGNQTVAFLSKELPAMGLNSNETSAFIAYWAPRLQPNKYTLIHFAGTDYTNVAKLTITPRPDSLLRVFMVEEPLNSPVAVTPQSFPSFHRSGFTAVEWGGMALK
ncbi:MAG TPA: hypothetical protein VMR75_01615 [Candidatus Saccharimonadales bacterium]|nr:hypothetical protein [Candidatus Saccharimonadales bacterium]